MNPSGIEKPGHPVIIDNAKRAANKRIQQVTVCLVADLFKAIEDLDLSATEF